MPQDKTLDTLNCFAQMIDDPSCSDLEVRDQYIEILRANHYFLFTQAVSLFRSLSAILRCQRATAWLQASNHIMTSFGPQEPVYHNFAILLGIESRPDLSVEVA